VSGPEHSVRIIGYSPEYAGDFARLNYQWIEHYFRIEDEDRAALDHPEAYAIAPGGQIFFVLQGEQVVGTVALVPKDLQADGSFPKFELAKMAVDPTYQGQGIGKELLDHAIAYARRSGVRQIVLSTNDVLAPALKVYGDAGFVAKPAAQDERYERSNLFMQLDL
jgi:GNAT superfamily N-acetyltransferase